MRFVTEGHIDMARYDRREVGLLVRATRLRNRYISLPEGPRKALLQAMEEAYLAAASGIVHRHHGSAQSARKLDKMADERLALARRYFGGRVEPPHNHYGHGHGFGSGEVTR